MQFLYTISLFTLEYLQDGRVNAFYSTPSIYTDAKNAADEEWPVKIDDFFPLVFFQTCCFPTHNFALQRPRLILLDVQVCR